VLETAPEKGGAGLPFRYDAITEAVMTHVEGVIVKRPGS